MSRRRLLLQPIIRSLEPAYRLQVLLDDVQGQYELADELARGYDAEALQPFAREDSTDLN